MKKFFRTILLMSILCVTLVGGSYKLVYAAEEVNTDNPEGEMLSEELPESMDNPADMMAYDENTEAMASGAGEGVPTPDGYVVNLTFPDELMPYLFHKTTTVYQGTTVEAAQFDNGNVLLVYLTDSTGANGSTKQYNESTGEFTDLRMVAGPGENYIIVLPLDENVPAPEGFEEVELDWNGQTLSAYINTSAVAKIGSDTSASDYLLLYAVGSSGRVGWYFYDQIEGTYQRYLDVAGASSAGSDEGVFNFAGAFNGNSDALVRVIIFAALVILVIVLLILTIVLSVRLKEYSGYDYIDEEDYNAYSGAGAYENAARIDSVGIEDDEEAKERASAEAAYAAVKRHEEMERRNTGNVAVSETDIYKSEEEPAKAPERPVMEAYGREDSDAITEQNQPKQNQPRHGQPKQGQPEQQSDYPKQNDYVDKSGSISERVDRAQKAQRSKPVQADPYSARRRSLLETGDIADLDDILNDPNSTSNLPLPSEIRKELEKRGNRPRNERAAQVANERAAQKKSHSYEDMQVTVDRFDPGMPAMVDTKMITADMGLQDQLKDYPQNTGYDDSYGDRSDNRSNNRAGGYSDEYAGGGYSSYGDDDDYYLTRAQKKERKALEKQRRREAKEAERDARYLEKERRRVEKNKRYGYDEATPMDWSEFGNSMREESTAADDRRPTGYDEERLPSYMRGREAEYNNSDNEPASPRRGEDRKTEARNPEVRNSEERRPERKREYVPTEEERANAAADAVIAAARGNGAIEEIDPLEAANIRKEQEYQEYRKNARNQYEEYRKQDEEMARMENEGPMTQANQNQAGQHEQMPPVVPAFSADFDEDFEFEFLNIKRPQ